MKFTRVFLRGLISYNGGKKRLADELTPLFIAFDSHTFIDLCGGSGVVTVSQYAQRRIINDLSTELAVIYKALADCGSDLAENLVTLEIDEDTYKAGREFLKNNKDKKLGDYNNDELVCAASYSWFVHYFSRVGSSISNNPNFEPEKVNRWLKLITTDIAQFIVAFTNVEVWNLDVSEALKKIKAEIDEECTIYIDPPYLSVKGSNVKTSKNTYKNNSSSSNCGFSEEKHIEMLQLVNDFPNDRFHVIISNYENDLYDNMLETDEFQGWTKKYLCELAVQCESGGAAAAKKRVEEYVYINCEFED